MQDILNKAAKVKLVIFDVDGVLTDGSLYIADNGEEYKAFNSKDGHGMRILQDAGIDVAIITGRVSRVVQHRMKELGVKYVFQGRREKAPAYRELLETTGLSPEQTAYVGDDVVDLPVMSQVGLAIAVQDAHSYVKYHAHWVTDRCGGQGAARDVCELILQAHGLLDELWSSYVSS